CVGWLMTSCPATRMLPRRRPTRPRMAFNVVVRPAPLRPSRVTTSPRLTLRSMPCRTWDSPYQACRPSMCSRLSAVRAAEVSDIGGSHVGGHDGAVAGDFRVRPFGQNLALVEYGNGVGEFGNDAEIVLDHQHGTVGRHL